ncbi:MAG: class I SAM-dependent methyltransferase [Gemmobacter sp.]
MTAPMLTDPAALARSRARATAMFLQDRMADEIEERLAEVNRTFTAPAIVTPFPAVWAHRLPTARIVPEGDALDLAPGAHDLVIHALCLHWANDPVGQIVQAARALRPDGLLLASLFGGATLATLRRALAEAEAERTGGLSPRVLPMAEIRDLGALLQRAGLALPVADAVPLTVTYADTVALMRDLRAMGEGNALAGRLRRPTRRAVLASAAARHDALAAQPDGRVAALFEVIVLTGWSPHPDQPRPLRPGSATARLADVLPRRDDPRD